MLAYAIMSATDEEYIYTLVTNLITSAVNATQVAEGMAVSATSARAAAQGAQKVQLHSVHWRDIDITGDGSRRTGGSATRSRSTAETFQQRHSEFQPQQNVLTRLTDGGATMTGKIISANSDGSYQVQLDMQARQESDVHHSRLKHIGGTDITVQRTNSFAVDDEICMRNKTHHRGTVTEMNCTSANNASGDGNRNGSVAVRIAELGKREVIAADDMSRISRLKSACGGNDGGISTGDEVLVKSQEPERWQTGQIVEVHEKTQLYKVQYAMGRRLTVTVPAANILLADTAKSAQTAHGGKAEHARLMSGSFGVARLQPHNTRRKVQVVSQGVNGMYNVQEITCAGAAKMETKPFIHIDQRFQLRPGFNHSTIPEPRANETFRQWLGRFSEVGGQTNAKVVITGKTARSREQRVTRAFRMDDNARASLQSFRQHRSGEINVNVEALGRGGGKTKRSIGNSEVTTNASDESSTEGDGSNREIAEGTTTSEPHGRSTMPYDDAVYSQRHLSSGNLPAAEPLLTRGRSSTLSFSSTISAAHLSESSDSDDNEAQPPVQSLMTAARKHGGCDPNSTFPRQQRRRKKTFKRHTQLTHLPGIQSHSSCTTSAPPHNGAETTSAANRTTKSI